jgi:quercetin dioxygenase-like cupin family protein
MVLSRAPGHHRRPVAKARRAGPQGNRAHEEGFMNRIPCMRHRAALAFATALVAAGPALAADTTMVNPEAVQWGDAPPVLPKGAKLAVLHGDPSKAGPIVMRLKVPAGYKIAPHTHTKDEQLTIVSGALYLGMGDKMDGKAEPLKAGGFHYLPGGTPHYAYTKSPTIVQINGEGPFDIKYLKPEDNPDKSAKP